MEPRLRLERLPPRTGLESGTARSVGQRLTYWATGAPVFSGEKERPPRKNVFS